jgi:hypothetical protein
MVHSCNPGSFFLVIPDIFNRESILFLFRMDPRYQPAGMTTGVFSIKTTSSIYLTYPSTDVLVFTPYFWKVFLFFFTPSLPPTFAHFFSIMTWALPCQILNGYLTVRPLITSIIHQFLEETAHVCRCLS